jgi:NADH-quinone oxidoreductase subunit A
LITFVIFLIILVLFTISFVLGYNESETTEVSSYECGFSPFTESHVRFNIKFYIISALFVLFDLEIVLLFPFTVSISRVGRFGYYIVVFFLALLTLAFIFEWQYGLFDFMYEEVDLKDEER